MCGRIIKILGCVCSKEKRLFECIIYTVNYSVYAKMYLAIIIVNFMS